MKQNIYISPRTEVITINAEKQLAAGSPPKAVIHDKTGQSGNDPNIGVSGSYNDDAGAKRNLWDEWE